MKAVRSRLTRGLPLGAWVDTCDNSGAKIVKIITVCGYKGVAGRKPTAAVGDLLYVSVVRGRPDMRKQVVPAVVVRQKKEWRRQDGMRIGFEDNAAVVLKDEQGNPKGTMIKGPIAKEIVERYPAVAKIASIIV